MQKKRHEYRSLHPQVTYKPVCEDRENLSSVCLAPQPFHDLEGCFDIATVVLQELAPSVTNRLRGFGPFSSRTTMGANFSQSFRDTPFFELPGHRDLQRLRHVAKRVGLRFGMPISLLLEPPARNLPHVAVALRYSVPYLALDHYALVLAIGKERGGTFYGGHQLLEERNPVGTKFHLVTNPGLLRCKAVLLGENNLPELPLFQYSNEDRRREALVFVPRKSFKVDVAAGANSTHGWQPVGWAFLVAPLLVFSVRLVHSPAVSTLASFPSQRSEPAS